MVPRLSSSPDGQLIMVKGFHTAPSMLQSGCPEASTIIAEVRQCLCMGVGVGGGVLDSGFSFAVSTGCPEGSTIIAEVRQCVYGGGRSSRQWPLCCCEYRMP